MIYEGSVEGANLSVAKGIVIKEMKIVDEDNFKKSIHHWEKEEHQWHMGPKGDFPF